jgi:hypothetical protein
MNHALKIEDLELNKRTADAIVKAVREFILELGYSKDRISELDCRSRDGFIPFSHNKGGLEAIAFIDLYSAYSMGGVGFDNADVTIVKYYEYCLESLELKNTKELTEEQHSQIEHYCSEDTVLFSLDAMLTDEHTINLRFCVCAKDTPYHRQYDDLIDIDVEFKNVTELKKKLKKLLKNEDIKMFSLNLDHAY